ncbi:tRNA (guanosine(46)-N7)-methyltransferase TrmB [Rhodohalobacter halophilus]|uniref:tRNA (guanosine(46)-N7)-methyltransferase TrmB n=1 Tax=Rhodohalobacter halophilus TaxID=1812810 RepID=UPI00083F8D8D|nr:tRNA (guanosine(46)-N7)-methyltransferase TrmB [Rhodohalobacter halophilus]
MAKNKLQKFEDVDRFSNVFEYTDFEDGTPKPKGTWHKEIFKNNNPIVLELACGKGEYTVNLARKNPDKNYIGIDKKGWRLWKGAKKALEEPLPNVHFMRIYIDHLADYFEKGEVDEIWITFPDPYLRDSKSSKRLTSPKFLDIYRKVAKPGTIIHLKTDSVPLFRFTLETIEAEGCEIVDRVDNVYAERPEDPVLSIKTFYEKMHLEENKTIQYVAFKLK